MGLAQAHCAESRAQLAADTQKQNLARPLPPSPQKGDGRAGSLCFYHSNPELRAQRASTPPMQAESRAAPRFGTEHRSPARSPAPNAELFSASPEPSRGTSRVSCWLAPTPCANPARPQLHAANSGPAAKPSNNEQLLSWAGVKIFQHPRLRCSTAIKNQMDLFSLLPPPHHFFIFFKGCITKKLLIAAGQLPDLPGARCNALHRTHAVLSARLRGGSLLTLRLGPCRGEQLQRCRVLFYFHFHIPLELLAPCTGISSRSQDDFARHNPPSLSRLRAERLLLEAFTPFPPQILTRSRLLPTHFYTEMTLPSAQNQPCLTHRRPVTPSLGFRCVFQLVPTWLPYSRDPCLAEGKESL